MSRRDLFLRGPGPDNGSSKPFRDRWLHEPDKSGMDTGLCVPLSPGATMGSTSCPELGVAAIAANVTSERKFHCTFMLPSFALPQMLHPLRVRLNGRAVS